MPGHRTKVKTLTKINPSVLKPKLEAVSQHSAGDGKRVTTAVKPVRQPPASPHPLQDLDIFCADVSGFNEEHLEDDEGDEVGRGYYVARVCTSRSLRSTWRLIPARTTQCYCGSLNA